MGGYGGANTVGDIAADYLGLPTNAEKARLYHNNGDGTFTDVTKQAHLDKVIHGMGINYGDLDNDGWLDFYVGTGDPEIGMLIPNRMFRNHDGRYFDEVTTGGDFGDLQKGHGIAFGDLSNNGQQDVFEVMGGAYSGDTAHDVLFVNPGSRNHWVTLGLEGVKSNRIALGAEVCVTAATPRGDRRIYRTVSTGGQLRRQPAPPGDRPGGRDWDQKRKHPLARFRHHAADRGPRDGPVLQGPRGRPERPRLAGEDLPAPQLAPRSGRSPGQTLGGAGQRRRPPLWHFLRAVFPQREGHRLLPRHRPSLHPCRLERGGTGQRPRDRDPLLVSFLDVQWEGAAGRLA